MWSVQWPVLEYSLQVKEKKTETTIVNVKWDHFIETLSNPFCNLLKLKKYIYTSLLFILFFQIKLSRNFCIRFVSRVCSQKLGRSVDCHPRHTELFSFSSSEAPHIGCCKANKREAASVRLELRDAEKRDLHCRRSRQTRGYGGARLQKMRNASGCNKRELLNGGGGGWGGVKVTANLWGAKAVGKSVVWLDILDRADMGREEMKLEKKTKKHILWYDGWFFLKHDVLQFHFKLTANSHKRFV